MVHKISDDYELSPYSLSYLSVCGILSEMVLTADPETPIHRHYALRLMAVNMFELWSEVR